MSSKTVPIYERLSEILPSAAIECYSPWRSPESPTFAAAMKAFPLLLNCPWNDFCPARSRVASLSAACLSPGNPLGACNAQPLGE